MVYAALGAVIAVGIAFLLWVFFKLTWDRSRTSRPRVDEAQSPGSAAEQPEGKELATAQPQRAGAL